MEPYDTNENAGARLTPAEVEMVLRRAAELSARRRGSDTFAQSVSPELLVQVAGALGIASRTLAALSSTCSPTGPPSPTPRRTSSTVPLA
jgi:hypothetical protein